MNHPREAKAIETPDDVLIRRAQRGDRAALERVMGLLLPRVRRWARTHIEDGDDADDVAQATLIKVANGIRGFDFRAKFETWIHLILRRCVADHFREARRARLSGGRLDESKEESSRELAVEPTESDVDADRAVGWIRRAFLELPNRQREVFDLVDLQRLSAEEAAVQLGVAAATVRVHLHRARRTLRLKMLQNEPAIAEDRGGLPNRI